MCGTCGCKSAESGKKNCGCGQDPCKTFGAENPNGEGKQKKAKKVIETAMKEYDEYVADKEAYDDDDIISFEEWFDWHLGDDELEGDEETLEYLKTLPPYYSPETNNWIWKMYYGAETFEARTTRKGGKHDPTKTVRDGTFIYTDKVDGIQMDYDNQKVRKLGKDLRRQGVPLKIKTKNAEIYPDEDQFYDELDKKIEAKEKEIRDFKEYLEKVGGHGRRELMELESLEKELVELENTEYPEMVYCSFCSKIIGTEEEVYDEESVEWYNANGETICPSCHKQREQEYKNDLDPHYSPFYAENERPKEMSYFFVYVPSETGKYGREGEKYDVHYFRTLEEAQKAFGDSYEIYEYRALEDVPPEEREKQKQDNQEWYDRAKKGEFFEDFWWKNEMSRYGNSDYGRLHHSTYDSSVENDERDGFYEKTILPSEPSRREQETNRYLADDLGISETLAELLNASRTFGMYISQRAHPDTVKKYRQRILDGFDAYSPESKKEQKIVKMVRQNMATRGVKGPSPSYVGTNRGILRKPELYYAYDDYYDNPIPFMGYELTDEEKKIIGDVKSAETEKPFWENITMSSKKKKDFSPLYHGLIAGALGVVALKIMDRVKK